jgi:dATP pyrophosphohydrolase
MARAKYQVLVIPFHIENDKVSYCVFHRSQRDAWQFIAGGGEDEDDSVMMTAKREAYEEAKISPSSPFIALESLCSVPAYCFEEVRKHWGQDCLVVPEYAFAVRMKDCKLQLSSEHTEYAWVDYDTAVKRLKYDSNRTALWELDQKIKLGMIG